MVTVINLYCIYKRARAIVKKLTRLPDYKLVLLGINVDFDIIQFLKIGSRKTCTNVKLF